MNVIDRFRGGKQNDDSQLDADLEKINRSIQELDRRRQAIFRGEVSVATYEEYDNIEQSIYICNFQRRRLLKKVDSRGARLAKAALSSRENTTR